MLNKVTVKNIVNSVEASRIVSGTTFTSEAVLNFIRDNERDYRAVIIEGNIYFVIKQSDYEYVAVCYSQNVDEDNKYISSECLMHSGIVKTFIEAMQFCFDIVITDAEE